MRYADGAETYLTFSGEVEHPEPREVIFADEADNAHARRWTNRQSGLSAVRDDTCAALIVAEALHETARADVDRLGTALSEADCRHLARQAEERVAQPLRAALRALTGAASGGGSQPNTLRPP